MTGFRKNIARQSWLMAVIIFTLLTQVQQALACQMMMDTSAPAVEFCMKHTAGDQQASTTGKSCCDLSSAASLKSGFCNDDHESVVNHSLSGKLNPDFHLALITVIRPDVFFSSHLTAQTTIPDRSSSQPGNYTYLATQRLRI